MPSLQNIIQHMAGYGIAYQFGGEMMEFSNRDNLSSILEMVNRFEPKRVGKQDISDWEISKWAINSDTLISYDNQLVLCIPDKLLD